MWNVWPVGSIWPAGHLEDPGIWGDTCCWNQGYRFPLRTCFGGSSWVTAALSPITSRWGLPYSCYHLLCCERWVWIQGYGSGLVGQPVWYFWSKQFYSLKKGWEEEKWRDDMPHLSCHKALSSRRRTKTSISGACPLISKPFQWTKCHVFILQSLSLMRMCLWEYMSHYFHKKA